MPKRVIDFDAMWGSDKLAACAEWAQAEYAWLYGLADASGSFELTNLRVIWGRVAAVRGNFTIERLEQVFQEFHEKGLMFIWMHEGKRYAHWTGSDVPGRLPAPSWRMRLEKFAPPVPKEKLAEYMARFARGRASLGAAGFLGAARESEPRQENLKFGISELKKERAGAASAGHGATFEGREVSGGPACKVRLEEAQGQDLDRNLNRNLERGVKGEGGTEGGAWEKGTIGNLIRGIGMDQMPGVLSNSCEKTNSKSSFQYELNSDSKTNAKAPGKINSDSLIGSDASSVMGPESGIQSETHNECKSNLNSESKSTFDSREERAQFDSRSQPYSSGYFYVRGMTVKEIATEKELRVGQGPVCGPKGVRPEILERERQRNAAARAAGGKGK